MDVVVEDDPADPVDVYVFVDAEKNVTGATRNKSLVLDYLEANTGHRYVKTTMFNRQIPTGGDQKI